MNKETAILITGASGFVGAYLVQQLLAAGYRKLYAIRRADSKMDLLGELASKLQWREADLEDYFSLEEALEGIDTVIHCAALVSFSPRDKNRLITINRKGTKHLVDAALFQKVRRLIYVSSVAALGRNIHGVAISEDDKWEDSPIITNYSRSKFLAELEVWRGQAEGLSVAAVYPSIILGAGRWSEGTAKMFAYVQKQPAFYPTGSTGVVDVRDVAKALQLVLERDQDRDRFLLNGSNIPYQQLLALMAKAFGQPVPHRHLPFIWAKWLARLEAIRSKITGIPPLLTRETVRATYQHLVYDSSRSEDILKLPYHSIEDTIRETVHLFKETNGSESALLAL